MLWGVCSGVDCVPTHHGGVCLVCAWHAGLMRGLDSPYCLFVAEYEFVEVSLVCVKYQLSGDCGALGLPVQHVSCCDAPKGRLSAFIALLVSWHSTLMAMVVAAQLTRSCYVLAMLCNAMLCCATLSFAMLG